jgi:hypothetical protein
MTQGWVTIPPPPRGETRSAQLEVGHARAPQVGHAAGAAKGSLDTLGGATFTVNGLVVPYPPAAWVDGSNYTRLFVPTTEGVHAVSVEKGGVVRTTIVRVSRGGNPTVSVLAMPIVSGEGRPASIGVGMMPTPAPQNPDRASQVQAAHALVAAQNASSEAGLPPGVMRHYQAAMGMRPTGVYDRATAARLAALLGQALGEAPTATARSYVDLTEAPTATARSYVDLTEAPTATARSYVDLTEAPTAAPQGSQNVAKGSYHPIPAVLRPNNGKLLF